MTSELELLHYAAMTATVNRFRFMTYRLQQVLCPARPLGGETAEWDILTPSRDKGDFNVPGAPSKPVALEPTGHQVSRCLEYFEHKFLPGQVLNNLRNIGSDTRQAAARARITLEQEALARRNTILKEWGIASMLAGTLTVAQDDVKVSVDYGIPATHTTAPSTVWTNAAATIAADVQGWRRLIAQDSGLDATEIWANSNVIPYLYRNTELKAIFSDGIKDQISRTASVTGFLGCNWTFYDNGRYDGTTFYPFIPDGYVACFPRDAAAWCAMHVGSSLIPSGSGNELVEVMGQASYPELIKDPPALKVLVIDRFLPMLLIPGAVTYVKVIA